MLGLLWLCDLNFSLYTNISEPKETCSFLNGCTITNNLVCPLCGAVAVELFKLGVTDLFWTENYVNGTEKYEELENVMILQRWLSITGPQ